MMNGLFLSNGILPCSVPSKRLQEYNTLLIDFYKSGEYKPVINFYNDCHRNIYIDWKTDFPDNESGQSDLKDINNDQDLEM